MVDLIWLAGAVNDEEADEEIPELVPGEEGQELDPEFLQKGIEDEMSFMKKIGIFEESTAKECWEKTGKAPTTTRWVSVRKVLDDGEIIVRSRLVGRDFKTKSGEVRADLFAATLPLGALKLLFRLAMVRRAGERERD